MSLSNKLWSILLAVVLMALPLVAACDDGDEETLTSVPTIAVTQIATASPTATYTPEDHLSPLNCTAFRLLDSSGRPIIGSASDTGDDIWAGGCSLFVNKRNVSKTGVDLIPDQQPATWISKYGSVAFGKFGREFPSEGVNEAGLVIKVLALIEFEQVKPTAPDSRPYVFGNFQWAQYQLDNSSTVQEVIESNSIIRPAALYPMDYLTHFWVSDRNGDCAVIEFLDGKMVCHSTSGEQNMPYKSITNATYEDSVSYLSQFEGFGGNDPIPDESADDKLSRFVQSVYWVQEYSGDSDPIDYAFDALDYVGQTGDVATRQKLVYDLQHLRVYFRTPENLNIRYFDLDSFDFSCETPVTMLDIKANLSGDVSGDFIVYDPEANHRQVENFCNYAFFQNPPEGLVDTISQYPESTEPIAEPTEEPIVEPTAEPTAEPTEAPVDEGDDDDTPVGLILGIVIFVCVILGLGAYFLVIRRRRIRRLPGIA